MRTRDFDWSNWTDTRQKCGWHRVYKTPEGDLVMLAYCNDPTHERVAVNAPSVAKFSTLERAKYVAVRNSQQKYELLTLDEFDRMAVCPGWDPSKNHYLVPIDERPSVAAVPLATVSTDQKGFTYSELWALIPEFAVPKDQTDMGVFRVSRVLATQGKTATLIVGAEVHGLVRRLS